MRPCAGVRALLMEALPQYGQCDLILKLEVLDQGPLEVTSNLPDPQMMGEVLVLSPCAVQLAAGRFWDLWSWKVNSPGLPAAGLPAGRQAAPG